MFEKDLLKTTAFGNTPLLEELFEKYKKNPSLISSEWKELFNQIISIPTEPRVEPKPSLSDCRLHLLLEAYRRHGHLAASFNPLAEKKEEIPKELDPKLLGFSDTDLSMEFPSFNILEKPVATLKEILDKLQSIYCGKIGIEYKELANPELIKWIQERIEAAPLKKELSIEEKKMILSLLNKSELFEIFLHTKYTGQKRFSLEGAETIIPMIEAILDKGGQTGCEEVVLGMSHRGRLNVLSNILNKSYEEIFSEFEEGVVPESIEGGGDVKYHKGYYTELSKKGKNLKITLTPNPSHLESVNPVVEGEARAKLRQKKDLENKEKVIPILLHGDAAISGQGVVYETMQFSHLPCYETGGTIHIVINNQIGFTTKPEEGRSTLYCTDVAKTFGAPVFHVNAEDPEGSVFIADLAVEMRQRFHCDVFIDLNCYRKYGHNETDEPAYTQPITYQTIRTKKSIREIYRDQLIHEGILEEHLVSELDQKFKNDLNAALAMTRTKLESVNKPPPQKKEKFETKRKKETKTSVSLRQLQEVTEKFSRIPEKFSLHPKLAKLVEERRNMIFPSEKTLSPIDWGMAEYLAYGTLLWDGVHIRITGQDVCRGTFSHRHAIWVDQKKETVYYPLQHLKPNQGFFEVCNSPLSEFASLGFEYGYSIAYLDALVIWEAQFGDFANGAQVIIDQYIAPAEHKWDQKSGLVLFLPHGYEGQGPEHSSGRLERFLTLCGNDNLQVVYPSTPAQFFHLLRKQVLVPVLKPLIIFTPKALLRNRYCVSFLPDFTDGFFHKVLKDPEGKNGKKLIFCSGKIFYDLMQEREKRKNQEIIAIRIEQLYPFPEKEILEVVKQYKGWDECLWVQEEPKNMGAWHYIDPLLSALLEKEVVFCGRPASATTATGWHGIHYKEYEEIMHKIFS